jgi:cell division initiation protein
MTQEQHVEHIFPFHRSPSAIRNEIFTHRMRGLDEAEVREYLDLIADQVEAADAELAQARADNERLLRENTRLKADNERLRAEEPEQGVTDINPQAVALFRQAQRAADQLVEEAVQHVKELMTNARAQQREILRQAHETAEALTREARLAEAPGVTGVPDLEYVRSLAAVAQAQLRSVLDVLGEQATRLGEASAAGREPVPPLPAVPPVPASGGSPVRTWQISGATAGRWGSLAE